MKTRFIKIAASFIAIVNASYAQDTLLVTLETCRDMAVKNSEVVKIADKTISKANGEAAAARSAYFPNISASAMGMYSKNEISQELYMPTQVFDASSGQLVPNVATNPQTGEVLVDASGNPIFNTYAYMPLDVTLYGGSMAAITAEQPIYVGGKIVAGNKMAKIGQNMAVENKMLKVSEIQYEADQMYFQYLSIQQKVKLAEKYKNLLEQLVTMVNDSYELGMTNRNELLKVKVQYNEATLQVQKAYNGLELTRMALCKTIGVDLYTPIMVNDSIGLIPVDEYILSTVPANSRAEYALLEQQVALAEQNVKMIKADYLPTVGMSVGYNYINLYLDNNTNSTDVFNAVASVSIPITTFGERKGKVASAQSDLEIKRLELQQAEKLLQLEIEQATRNLTDAITQVEMAQDALKQADENLRISQDNYNLGMETIVNLLEAQAEWQKTYSNYIDAITNFKIKESNYKRVTNSF